LKLNCDALGFRAYTSQSQNPISVMVDLRLWLGMQYYPLDRSPSDTLERDKWRKTLEKQSRILSTVKLCCI